MAAAKAVETPAPSIRDRVLALIEELKAACCEREAAVYGLLVAVLAGEHIFMIGPPGTAKSLLARLFARAVGGTYFEYLLTRYSEPNEVFGPIDLQAWSATGAYGRRTAGYFPEAHVAFLDEIFKANSSILNSLLTAVNERVYHDGGQARPIPLRTVVAASNELPESEELAALFDRFVLRYEVGYTKSAASFSAICTGNLPAVTTQLSMDDIDAAQAEVAQVGVSDAAIASLFELRDRLAAEGIVVSDRRWRKLVSVLRAYAWLQGDAEVDSLHFSVLADGLWNEPGQRAKIASTIAKVSAPQLADALAAHDAIMEALSALPATGNVGLAGQTAMKEAKKAVARIEACAEGAAPAVARRVDALRAAVEKRADELTARVAAELGL